MASSIRLAVLADIHGNLPALEAVLADVARFQVDDIIVLGDLADRGPYPLETVRLVESMGGRMIRGNTDSRLVQLDAGEAPEGWRTHKQFAAVRWAYERLDRAAMGFLAALPQRRTVHFPGTSPIRLVHGTPRDPNKGIFPAQRPSTLTKALARVREPVLLCAHTHLQWAWERGRRLACNPGSVGQPFDGGRRARYTLLDWDAPVKRWEATHRAVAYDWDRTRRAFHESGLLEGGGAFVRACLMGLEAGRDVVGPFVRYAYGLAAMRGCVDCDVLPDPIWEAASATFEWPLVGGRSGVR